MRVTKSDREGVGGVGRGRVAAGEEAAHHHLDLRLLGMADADQGLVGGMINTSRQIGAVAGVAVTESATI